MLRTASRAAFWLLLPVLAAVLAVGTNADRPAAASPAPRAQEFAFHRDHILGTSLDLCVVVADEETAGEVELTVLNEIERLRLIFSTYDPASEISKLNRTRDPMKVSREMIEVLKAYELWQTKTGGAFNGQLGELARVWKDAEKDGREPDAATLAAIVRDLAKPGWKLDATSSTVTRLTDQPLNLNAIAKGYIIRKAARAALKQHPTVRGLLVNLGGDVFAWGGPPASFTWAVGIQDPFNHFDNAPPLAGVRLQDQAIATSGGYQRYYTINGKRYSHLLDPRTGRPAAGVASATVIANDNVTANALATSLCVLSPEEGLKLVAGVPGAECLIIAADGKRFPSPGLKLFEVTPARATVPQDKKDEPKAEAWPAGFQVTVAVQLPSINAARYHKPYTAIWIEDAKGNPVRTLAVWGNSPKYLKDLSDWWKIGKNDADLVKAVTRATRGPGKYDLVWDGKDDKGNQLPQGSYTVRVEVHRENGEHLRQSGKIECKGEPATAKLPKNGETAETVIEFKKVEKK